MKKTISPRRILWRVDLNAPSRLVAVQDELRRLLAEGNAVIIATHVGRPNGTDRALSTAPLAKALGVAHAKDVVGPSAKAAARALLAGQAVLLENLRFSAGEEKNSVAFARQLAALADAYVNDAFAVCHRAHASVAAITRLLPSTLGRLAQREVNELSAPRARPFALIVGGIKLETKVPLLRRLGKTADVLLLGSGLYPALAAAALPRAVVKKIIPMLDARYDARGRVIDIGPKTERAFVAALAGAKSIVWNGPLGVVERKDGSAGTRVIARAVAASKARSIVGGGETVDFLEAQGFAARFSFVSAGGGAMLAFLAGEPMPGLSRRVVSSK